LNADVNSLVIQKDLACLLYVVNLYILDFVPLPRKRGDDPVASFAVR
jgi:hypothetical protein